MQLRRWYTKPYLGVPINWEHDLAQGLVGRWLFNEGGGGQVYDAVNYPHGNNGILTNMDSLSDWVPGKFGHALDFDGSSEYVEVGTSLGNLLGDGVTSISCALRFKANRTNSDDGLINIGTLSLSQGELSIIIYANLLRFRLDNSAYLESYSFSDTINWHHVVFTYDGVNGIGYLDGIEIINQPFSNSLNLIGLKTIIGSYYHPSLSFDGLIDDVCIWNRALSAQEIHQRFIELFAEFERPSMARHFVPAVGAEVYSGRGIGRGILRGVYR